VVVAIDSRYMAFHAGKSFASERPPIVSLIIAAFASRLLSVQISLLFPLMSGELALLLSISGVAVIARMAMGAVAAEKG
jgi:hypothetical protein